MQRLTDAVLTGSTITTQAVSGGGTYGLTITGNAAFGAAVTGLTTLSVSGTTNVNGGTVTTSGTQSYNNLVIAMTPATLTTTDSNVMISGSTTLTTGLIVSDGAGNTTFHRFGLWPGLFGGVK